MHYLTYAACVWYGKEIYEINLISKLRSHWVPNGNVAAIAFILSALNALICLRKHLWCSTRKVFQYAIVAFGHIFIVFDERFIHSCWQAFINVYCIPFEIHFSAECVADSPSAWSNYCTLNQIKNNVDVSLRTFFSNFRNSVQSMQFKEEEKKTEINFV